MSFYVPNPTPEQLEILDGPSLLPPDGEVSNFENPYSIAPIVLGVAIAGGVLSTLFVAIRLYTKAFIIKSWNWEDVFVVLAWANLIAYFGVGTETTVYGGGKHQWDVKVKDLIPFLLWVNYTEILYNSGLIFIKTAICLQYIRVFTPISRGIVYWSIQLSLWPSVLFYIASMIIASAQCLPREAIYNPFVTGKCINIYVSFITASILNLISDLSLLIIPLFVTWRLKMNLRKKIAVSGVFVIGFLAFIASIMRMISSVDLLNQQDATFALLQVGLWTYAEMTCGLITQCLLVTPRFLQHIMPKHRVFQLTTKKSSNVLSAGTSKGRILSSYKPTSASRQWMEVSEQNDSDDNIPLNERPHAVSSYPNSSSGTMTGQRGEALKPAGEGIHRVTQIEVTSEPADMHR